MEQAMAGTTFAVPDLRGMVTAGKDDMGGVSANRLTSPINGDTLGATGGAEDITLSQAQMPVHAHAASVSGGGTFAASVVSINGDHVYGGGPAGIGGGAAYSIGGITWGGTVHTPVSFTSTGATDNRGSGTAHNNLQPTRIVNKIIRYL